MNLPPMGVTIYGRPQGLPAGQIGNASLELVVHHPGGGRVPYRVNLWDHGDQLAHDTVHNGDRSARGMLADWVDENQHALQAIPEQYRPYLGQLIRRGHRWPPEPPTPIGHETPPEPPARLSRRQLRVRYGRAEDHAEFLRQIAANPRDMTTRGVYADYLQEHEPGVDPKLLKTLRTHKGDVWVHHGPNGVVGGRPITWREIRRANYSEPDNYVAEHEYQVIEPQHDPFAEGEFGNAPHGQPHSGPGGHYFVTEERGYEAHPGSPPANVWRFHPETGGATEVEPQGGLRNAAHGHEVAAQLAATPPAPPPVHQPEPPPEPPAPPPPAAPPVRQPPRPVSLADLTRPRPGRKSRRHYARAGDPATHDALLRDIQHARDPQGLGVLADFLEEQGMPGARLARRGFHNAQDPEQVSHPFYPNQWMTTEEPRHLWTGEQGQDTQTTLSNAGNLEVRSSVSTPRYDGSRNGRLLVIHPPQVGLTGAQNTVEYSVPVDSVEDLHHLTSDLPEPMAARIREHLEPHLPRGGAKLSRRRIPRRYSATEGDVNNLLHQIGTNPEHRQPGSHLRLVAADALQEQGREREADVLRNHPHAIQVHEGRVLREYPIPQRHRETARNHRYVGDNALHRIYATGLVNGADARNALEEIDERRSRGGVGTGLDNPNNRQALDRLYDHLARIERETADEGHDDREEPDDYEPPGTPTGGPTSPGGAYYSRRRYAAYRAPAGGMVVRGTQYPGGSMVPDMEGAFANPPSPPTKARVVKPRRPTPPLKMAEGQQQVTPPAPAPDRRAEWRNRVRKLVAGLTPTLTTGKLSVSRQSRRVAMSTTVVRYGAAEDRKSFMDKLSQNESDTTTRKVFADWLEENHPDTHPNVLHTLRNYEGRLWVGLSPKGQVNAIPRLSKELLEKYPNREAYHSTSRNSRGQAHRVRPSGRMKTWKTRPEEFRVPWKFGMYDNGEFNHRNVHEWLTDDPTAEPS